MPVKLYSSKVLSNRPVGPGVFLLKTLYEGAAAPGQFFMLRAWGTAEAPLLSRPISVHDCADGILCFLYEVRGVGTAKLAALRPGDKLSLTGPCGNGFPVSAVKGRVALVAGGIGLAPLLYTAKCLKNCTADLYCGFRDEPYALDPFAGLVRTIEVATDTGRFGHKGFVTDLLDAAAYDCVITCGPEVMMEKTAKSAMRAGVPVYVSKEAKMACGIGACLGCSFETPMGRKSVCKDGPVFSGSEVYAL